MDIYYPFPATASGNACAIHIVEQSEYRTITATRVHCACGKTYPTPIITDEGTLCPIRSRFVTQPGSFKTKSWDDTVEGCTPISVDLEASPIEIAHTITIAVRNGLQTGILQGCPGC